jgi:two-component system NtrC family sensor kinase
MSKGSFVSDVFLGYRNVPHLVIAIKREESDNDWILRATINSRSFDSLVQTGQMGKSTVAFIINRKGLLQTPSRLEHRSA